MDGSLFNYFPSLRFIGFDREVFYCASILGISGKKHFSKQLGESDCNLGAAASHEGFASAASG